MGISDKNSRFYRYNLKNSVAIWIGARRNHSVFATASLSFDATVKDPFAVWDSAGIGG